MEASHLEVVKYLIENGADINAKDSNGDNLLMIALEYRELDIVKYLLEKGANVNIKNNEGKTVLDLARNEDIKELLRKAGAK